MTLRERQKELDKEGLRHCAACRPCFYGQCEFCHDELCGCAHPWPREEKTIGLFFNYADCLKMDEPGRSRAIAWHCDSAPEDEKRKAVERMGEAKRKEAATMAADKLNGSITTQTPLHVTHAQASAIFALERCIGAMHLEAGQLVALEQKEVAGELAAAVEHLTKYRTRFVADCQRTIKLASLADVAGLTKQ